MVIRLHGCSHAGCERKARNNANGDLLCHMHYQRWIKYGSTILPNLAKSPDGKCIAFGCTNSIRSGNSEFCEAHYYRLRRGSKDGLGPINKVCRQCGNALSANQSRFCTSLCGTRHLRGTPNTRTCLICSKQFDTWERAAVCSKECRVALQRGNGHRRRAKIRNLPREIFSAKEIFERDKWVCQLCWRKTNRKAHPRHNDAPSLDHIIPIKLGGCHTRVNTQCTHLMCNFIKQGRAIGQLRMFG
jgi:predicted nucleic acid-binding Zn ribbon protein